MGKKFSDKYKCKYKVFPDKKIFRKRKEILKIEKKVLFYFFSKVINISLPTEYVTVM